MVALHARLRTGILLEIVWNRRLLQVDRPQVRTGLKFAAHREGGDIFSATSTPRYRRRHILFFRRPRWLLASRPLRLWFGMLLRCSSLSLAAAFARFARYGNGWRWPGRWICRCYRRLRLLGQRLFRLVFDTSAPTLPEGPKGHITYVAGGMFHIPAAGCSWETGGLVEASQGAAASHKSLVNRPAAWRNVVGAKSWEWRGSCVVAQKATIALRRRDAKTDVRVLDRSDPQAMVRLACSAGRKINGRNCS